MSTLGIVESASYSICKNCVKSFFEENVFISDLDNNNNNKDL